MLKAKKFGETKYTQSKKKKQRFRPSWRPQRALSQGKLSTPRQPATKHLQCSMRISKFLGAHLPFCLLRGLPIADFLLDEELDILHADAGCLKRASHLAVFLRRPIRIHDLILQRFDLLRHAFHGCWHIWRASHTGGAAWCRPAQGQPTARAHKRVGNKTWRRAHQTFARACHRSPPERYGESENLTL